MTVSSDDESVSITERISSESVQETEPLGFKPSIPSGTSMEGPSTEQLAIKTENSGMDTEAIEAALENHTAAALQSAHAKKALNNSGLSQTEIVRRVRQIAAEKGEFEYHDFEVLDADAEDFDFSVFSSKEFKPDYIKPDSVTVIPGRIFDLRMVKNEPEQLARASDANGEILPIDRWWRDENPQSLAKRKKLSNTLVDTSADESNTTICHGKDPAASTKTFTHFLMKPDRRSALILELSKLHPDGAIIFHETPEEAAKKRDNKLFFEKCRRTLNDSNPTGLDHLEDMLDLLSENPENFFVVKALIDELVSKGFSSPAQIVSRLTYDVKLGKPVILPQGQHDVDTIHPDPKTQAMLCAFDATTEADSGSAHIIPVGDDPTKANDSGNDSEGNKGKSRNDLSVLGPPIMRFNSTGNGLGMNGPRFSSTPRAKGPLANKSAFFPQPPSKKSRNFSLEGFLNTTDGAPIQPEEYMRRHKVAGGFLKRISDFPIQGRKTVGAWKALVRQRALQKPTPYDYHPRYSGSKGFLNQSFSGEALPGVFRPCSSGMSESEATKAYQEAKHLKVSSLIELNAWVKATYPPDPVVFDPDKHSIECEGYDLDFWSEVKDLHLARTGASLNASGIVPHCPMDRVTTDQYFKLYSEYLEPLAPYVADTLLTTLGPTFSTRRDYMWWSIPVPQMGGDLVIKDALFDYNGMSFIISNASQVGRCGVCRGLLLTPHHVTFLAYFYPDGLEKGMVNASILQNWAAQRIAVCYIHAVTDAVNKPDRQLQ